MVLVRSVVVVAASLLAGAAWAAEPSESEQRAACTGDVMRLCFSQIPNRAKISECMVANKASLSPRCRSVVDATLQARVNARN